MAEGKISYKSVYNGYWKCRDFELQHFWQRSVFLTAFLISCFAGYGGLVVAVLGCANLSAQKLMLVNGIGFAISLVGIVLSLLWIMMAKGSKAWYERWENAIDAFCGRYKNEAFTDPEVAHVAGFRIGNIMGFESPDKSGFLWNTKGGSYSPSKINIAIGHLSLLIWFSLSIAHVCLAKVGLSRIAENGWLYSIFTDSMVMYAVLVFGLLGFFLYTLCCLKSSTL